MVDFDNLWLYNHGQPWSWFDGNSVKEGQLRLALANYCYITMVSYV